MDMKRSEKKSTFQEEIMFQKFIRIIVKYSGSMMRLFMWIYCTWIFKSFQEMFYNQLLKKLSCLKIKGKILSCTKQWLRERK